MINGTLKSKIDKLWDEFHTGGITNPLTVIEQITYLIYARMLDMNERIDEKRAARTGNAFTHRFPADKQHIRWEQFRHLSADELYPLVKDQLFPFFATLAGEDTLFAEFMQGAQLMIQKQSLLARAVELVNELPLENKDVKGDLYEYLLSKLTTAGINGQFRTPRHIIRAMVEMLDIDQADRICDPACGTGGFLAVSYEYLLEKYSSADGIEHEPVLDENGQPQLGSDGKPLINTIYTGDLLDPAMRDHIDYNMFTGFDFDSTMLRVAAMNLVMHGIKEPGIYYQDTLSQSFAERKPREAKDRFDIILANPPFKGSLDADDVDPAILKVVKTKKTELLFLALIERMLKVGGRSATIVPDGVLFGSSKAHQTLRQHLVEDNQLEAVISLPSGVFKPYAGVSTAILLFTKGGSTNNVWFYDLTADGFSLDDKRNPIKDNDLPDLVQQYRRYQQAVLANESVADWQDKTQQAFIVPKADIAAQKYDLSINRYKEVVYQAEQYDDPKVILAQLKALETDILADLDALEQML